MRAVERGLAVEVKRGIGAQGVACDGDSVRAVPARDDILGRRVDRVAERANNGTVRVEEGKDAFLALGIKSVNDIARAKSTTIDLAVDGLVKERAPATDP